MRTIERIVAEKLGEQEAIQFFLLASKHNFPEDMWKKNNLGREIVKCLLKSGVVCGDGEEENGMVKDYLMEMVAGRFAFVDEKDTAE